jgi:hypothetical protein
MTIMTMITRTAVASIIPKLISSVTDMFSSSDDNPRSATSLREKAANALPSVVNKPARKHDTTKFSSAQHDFITEAYLVNRANNLMARAGSRTHSVETQDDLTDQLNKQLDLYKSRTSYSLVWNNTIKREDLIESVSPFKED